MEQGALNKEQGKVLFFPIFLASTFSNFLDCVSILLDEMIVGNLFDDTAFGAINVIEPFQMIETFLAYMICIGGVAMIIRADGQKSYERINELFSHSITSCLLLGVIFFMIYSLFGNPMAKAVAGETETLPYVLQVISWNRLDALVEPTYVFLFTYVLLRGGSFYALFVTILEIALNFLLSVVLGKMMGIGGVVLATGIAFCIGILLLILFLFLKKEPIKVRPLFKAGLIKEMTVISFSEGSIVLAFAFMEAVTNQTSLTYYGIQGIAVAAVVINVFEIVIYVSEGISEYETAALNEYIGREDKDKVLQCMRVAIRAAVLEGAVFSILYFTMADTLVSLFDINDPLTGELAVKAVKMIAATPVIICLTRIFAIFYQYTKRVRRAAFLVIMSWGLLPALFVWLFGQIAIEGVTLGLILGSSVALFLMLLYVRGLKKEKFLEYKK
ncbi:MAG: hypothetical protein K6E75_13995 [Lachnospiraceae bacterium]|nr:hypothetical protein [Lachnospiraceae bacterium]